jgi:hypothetical protein
MDWGLGRIGEPAGRWTPVGGGLGLSVVGYVRGTADGGTTATAGGGGGDGGRTGVS